jgi:hypothetical protein
MAVIQFKRATKAWLDANGSILVPSQGEPVWAIDANTMKIGDGQSSYEDLPYFVGDNDSLVQKVFIFKGTLGVGGTVSTLPSSYQAGWTYKVITAGTYAGEVCEVGDFIVSLEDRPDAGGANEDWTVLQGNIDQASSVSINNPADNRLLTSDGTTDGINAESTLLYSANDDIFRHPDGESIRHNYSTLNLICDNNDKTPTIIGRIYSNDSEALNNGIRDVGCLRIEGERYRGNSAAPSGLLNNDHLLLLRGRALGSDNVVRSLAGMALRVDGDLGANVSSGGRINFGTRSSETDNIRVWTSLRQNGNLIHNGAAIVNTSQKTGFFQPGDWRALATYNVADLGPDEAIDGGVCFAAGKVLTNNDLVWGTRVLGHSTSAQISCDIVAESSGIGVIGQHIVAGRNGFYPGDSGVIDSIVGQATYYGHSPFYDDANPTTKFAVGAMIVAQNGVGTINTAYDLYISGPTNTLKWQDDTTDLPTNISGSGIINEHYSIVQSSDHKNYFNGPIINRNYVHVDNIKIDENTISVENTNGNLILSPNAAGSLQTDSEGNVRGQYAVDLQRYRTSLIQVAAGNYSAICGGQQNVASGFNTTVLAGRENTAAGTYSIVSGFHAKARLYGEKSHASGRFADRGDAQTSTVVVRREILPTSADGNLTLNGQALSTSNAISLPIRTILMFNIKLSVYDILSHSAAAYNIVGAIKRSPTGVSLVDSLQAQSFEDDALSGLNWDVYADPVYNALGIRVSPTPNTRLRCVATVDFTQASFESAPDMNTQYVLSSFNFDPNI